MGREFIQYDQSVALKELGFDEPCLGNYADDEHHTLFTNGNRPGKTNAPLYQQAFRWFREKYEVFTYIHLYRTTMDGTPLEFEYYYRFPKKLKSETIRKFKSYEEAEQACLDKLIEICKNK